MSKVLRLWAPPGEDSASALFGHVAEKTEAGLARGEQPELLEYVEKCDVDARNGWGDIKLTRDASRARRFPDLEAALKYWRRQSQVRPLRPDGMPNRPLTAYNITIEEAP